MALAVAHGCGCRRPTTTASPPRDGTGRHKP
uniref:Uncharacterized protein n=1 Tax=Arundo donax TaxID=35708 RepID=A0A0A9EKP1_ARUDO